MTRHLYKACLLSTALIFATGCPSSSQVKKPRFQYVFPGQSHAGELAQAWFSGNAEKTSALINDPGKAAASVKTQTVPEAMFIEGEVHYWSGDVEKAFEIYKALLQTHAKHALARHAAARLAELHDEVINYHERMAPVLASISFDRVHPMTAVYLSTAAQRVHKHQWLLSKDNKPFSGDAVGLPTSWMASPQMSPWRLMDFDRDYDIERQPKMAESYLSPYLAENIKQNHEKPRPYITSGISLSPKLDSDGVYYMETWANVTGDAPQVFWLYGNFPSQASVIIDGIEVIKRTEGDYGTGRRLRRIKLAPGKHRVLVKLAFQQGYRDWFDLTFLNGKATALSGSNISFTHLPGESAASKQPVELLSRQAKPSDIEWTMTLPKDVKKADSMALYLTALSALQNRQSDFFEAAFDELESRHKKFAALYGLKSAQVQTLWELPSRNRNTEALKALRKASKLDPKSLNFTLQLGNWLKKRGKEKSVRKLLETARDQAVFKQDDGQEVLRNIKPLYNWGRYLQSQGWQEDAEKMWARVLKIAPNECNAASRLQRLYYGRKHYVPPKSLVADLDKCPQLQNYWIRIHPDQRPQRLALAKRNAERYPYSISHQLSYATQLRRVGKEAEAQAHIAEVSKRLPRSSSLKARMMDDALADKSAAEALRILDAYEKENGPDGWSTWRRTTITQKVPMGDLLRDGVKVAKEIVAQDGPEGKNTSTAKDEAFYAIDFASRRYFDDGSALSLTHTMVRVMTKNAIDKQGEVNLPRGARVILARTIKKDGSVREPELTSGKSTLSMPGLAEGDFVELAYLEYDSGYALSKTRTIGTKFFFQMTNVSSLHSEYVVINPRGKFLRKNNAPQAQKFTYKGQPATRFLRKDSPKPRPEGYAVSGEEYLPWVQLYQDGTTVSPEERRRRTYQESIRDSTKTSSLVNKRLTSLRAGLKGVKGIAKVKKLYYDVMATLPNPSESSGFSTDISHVLAAKEGSPFLLLYKALLDNGIKADIYLAKSKYQIPDIHPLTEEKKYTSPVIKITVPGTKQAVWVQNSGDQSMFGALNTSVTGQRALCITCSKVTFETLPETPLRPKTHSVEINAELDITGALSGKVRETLDGTQATYVRRLFLNTKEKTSRDKIISRALSAHIQGAAVSKYSIENEADPDKPITLVVEFVRPQFARKVRNKFLVVEKTLFRQPLGSVYANLPQRELPLFASYARNSKYSLKLKLPDGKKASLRSKTGKWEHNTQFGQFTRETTLQNNILTIENSFQIGIQRIQPKDYPLFQKWAIDVERSSILLMLVQ